MMKAACQASGRIIHLACRRMVGEGREAERERIGVLLGDRWNEIFLIWFWTLLGQAITFPLFFTVPSFSKIPSFSITFHVSLTPSSCPILSLTPITPKLPRLPPSSPALQHKLHLVSGALWKYGRHLWRDEKAFVKLDVRALKQKQNRSCMCMQFVFMA